MQAKLAIALVTAACLQATAEARPSVTVVGEAPFSERELGEAVELRIEHDVRIRVICDADGSIVIDVGGRRQRIDLNTRDPRSAARVVAMVVVALVEDSAAITGEPRDGEVVVRATSRAPERSRWSMRVVPIGTRDNNSSNNLLLTASLGYELAAHLRVVASIGAGTMSDKIRWAYAFPLRLGAELSGRGYGLEVGGMTIPYLSECNNGRTNAAYVAARKYIPITDQRRVVFELGGYRTSGGNSMCLEPPAYQRHAGWLGAGVEWSF